jgi:porin
VAGGLVVQGPIPSRPFDLLVLAAGRADLQPGPSPAWSSSYEGMLELGYQLRLNGNLALQPTLQWIANPSAGSQPLPGILAVSLQLSANF